MVPTPNPWGLPERTHRLLRGWGVASVAVFAGAGSHAVLTGHLPHPLILGLCWSLSGMLCVLLAGLRLPRVSTALGVLGSQAGLHCLLALAGHGTVHAAGTAAAAHLGHHALASAAPTASGGGPDAAQGIPPLMLAAHLAAAALTILAIRRGDAALAGLLRAVRLGLGALLAPRRPVPLPSRRPLPVIGRRRRAPRGGRRPGPILTRGPPVLMPA